MLRRESRLDPPIRPARELHIDHTSKPDGLLARHTSLTPSRVAAARESSESFERARDQLTPEQREAITRCKLSQLTTAQAGEVMDRSEDAVRQLLGRGPYRTTKVLEGEAS